MGREDGAPATGDTNDRRSFAPDGYPPAPDLGRLVLLRHAQSVWNAADRFTGWIDVPLSDTGRRQARDVAAALRGAGTTPTVIYTSRLRRALETATGICAALDLDAGLIRVRWQLNERHYGALEGMRRADARRWLGPDRYERVHRSWEGRPPPAPPLRDVRGGAGRARADPDPDPDVDPDVRINGESLREVSRRVVGLWEREIEPALRPGACALVVAHGNVLRALIKHLEAISDDAVSELEVGIAEPRWYRNVRGRDGQPRWLRD